MDKDFDATGLTEAEISMLEGDGEEAPQVESENQNDEPEAVAASDQDERQDEGGEDQGGEPSNPAEKAPSGYVPTRALQEAREEAKRIKEQLAQYQTWTQEIAGKLAEQKTQPQHQQQEEDQPPADWETDPIARMQWENQRLTEQLQAMQQGLTTQQQQQMQAQQEQYQAQMVIAQADQLFNAAQGENPDIQEAFQHAVNAVHGELQKRGLFGPQLKAEMDRHLLHYASQAPKEPAEFAEYVRRNARYWGWDGAKKPAGDTDAGQKIDRMAKAVKSNKTLSGGAGSGEMSLEDLAKMSGAELEKLAEENPELFAKFGA
ncbi:hypothetical protein [Pseudohoeflea coraliihabitans]|uniref:Uncharacterized protein n=1 Tax=Pseudohoeflea coraliihabitans TaxID=2860393 RepID=A0ABS6WTF9_9HYPH|nr:hypothetical protein [Pseudohoeflea sp. DP4N28-3]MBW3099226.1 hypothetical protein [Pseudohoeflea sp. DP4N28-3]